MHRNEPPTTIRYHLGAAVETAQIYTVAIMLTVADKIRSRRAKVRA